MTTLLFILLALMLIGAIIAVALKDLLSSVISLGVVGMLNCVVFILLRAPDIAIMQMVVEVLVLVFLIRLIIRHDDTTLGQPMRIIPAVAALFFGGIFLALMAVGIGDLPPFGKPLMTVAQHYVDQGLAQTGAANLVTGILLDYRGYDTLGEVTVLMVSIVGALVLMRRRAVREVKQ